MIAAISLMRRRPDLTTEQFRKHWLHPHGTMTAELPGVRQYVQHHPIEAPGTNAYAREIAIDGMPELWFDDYDQRQIAYTSPRMAECNIDSEHFVGSVTRLVTEPEVVRAAPALSPIKVLLLATGAADPRWPVEAYIRITKLRGVVGYVAHRLIDQAKAPNSKIPELQLQIAGVAEATFRSEADLAAASAMLTSPGSDATVRTAVYRIQDYVPPFPR